MKATELARHYEKCEGVLVGVEKDRLIKQIREYRHLCKAVYNLLSAPERVLMFRMYGDKAYVVKTAYVSFLRELAVLRYKISRKKFKGRRQTAAYGGDE